MRFATLEGARVAVWGYGREGHAALTALRARLPAQRLALFCSAAEAAEMAADPLLEVHAASPQAEDLAAFDFVVKSPGISAYRPEILAAAARGTRFTSGTALWFGEHPEARVIGVTGSKGKSTTSALIAHLARSLGVRTALAGNIGLPLLELLDAEAGLWVVELSSFQTGEAGPLAVGVVTSLFPEHLDWHGSAERYMADKLRIGEQARVLLVNGGQEELLRRTAAHPRRECFGVPAGWHVAGGEIRHGGQAVVPAALVHLPGAHNLGNACAALAALAAAGLDATAAAPALADFRALPHRLQPLGERAGLAWVDDSISTTPNAALVAIEALRGRPLVLLLGGFDRGIDWTDFARAVAGREDLHFVVQGGNGARIGAALAAAGVAAARRETLAAAMDAARDLAVPGAAVVLSPGAPSFDQFRDYRERGRRFAELAGFQSEETARIPGLGIA